MGESHADLEKGLQAAGTAGAEALRQERTCLRSSKEACVAGVEHVRGGVTGEMTKSRCEECNGEKEQSEGQSRVGRGCR